MEPSAEEKLREEEGSVGSAGDYTYDYMMNRVSYEEHYEISLKEFIKYWSIRFIINGMFTTSRILGYTQMMIYMILRVIIAGSLCGRFFGNDPTGTQCDMRTSTGNATAITTTDSSQTASHIANHESLDPDSYYVQQNCLNDAYGKITPITVWTVGLLPVFLSWLLLLPWTPFRYDQEFVVCKPGQTRWPCLTIYIVRFIRTFMRLTLELACLVMVPVIYGTEIPPVVTCFDDRISCKIHQYSEKTFFLWLLTTINLISCGLSAAELFDICRNKQQYEDEPGFSSSISKMSSARSSDSYLVGITSDRVQHYYEKKNERGIALQTTNVHNFEKEKRRIGATRACSGDTETKINSKFRGRHPKPGESDEVIKLASLKGDDLKNKDKNLQPMVADVYSPKLVSSMNDRPNTILVSLNSPRDVMEELRQGAVQKVDCTLETEEPSE